MAAAQVAGNGMKNLLKMIKGFNPKLYEAMSTMKPADALKFMLSEYQGFDQRILEKVNLVKCDQGKALAELVVAKEHANAMGSLHGGMSASLVDIVSSFALFTDERNLTLKSVSVDMHLTYYGGARIGETVEIHANTLKTGKNMAFAECEIKNKATGDILIKGLHSKFLIPL